MKIGFLITARLKSSRLPLKILKDLNGKTVIERIIERTKTIKGISVVVLCTSPNPQDKPLINIAEKNNIFCFLGDEEDVLQRLFDAAKQHNLDYFLGITADNPLFSIDYSNLIVDKIKKEGHDFIKVIGLPFGTATYGMNVKALATVCKIKTIVDTEIWGYLIDRPEVFDITTIESEKNMRRPNYRLTLDYEEDYKLLYHLYKTIPFKAYLDLKKVIEYLDTHPEIVKINQNCRQLDIDEDIKKKIDKLYVENIQQIKKVKNQIYGN